MNTIYHKLNNFALSTLPLTWVPHWLGLRGGFYAQKNIEMYLRTALWLKVNQIKGDIVEFGVGSGSSSVAIYKMISRTTQLELPHLYLFDSFQGLPQTQGDDQHAQWKKGSWSVDETSVNKRLELYNVNRDKFTTIPGYYEDTLKPELRDQLGLEKLALVHIDCDLYSSTQLALNFITPYVQCGTVILFDDFFCFSGNPNKGESKAFHEWIKDNSLISTSWHPYSTHGMSFILTKTEDD